MTQAVILIPGIMGSELRKNGVTIWPGSVASLLTPYNHMAELLDPTTEVGDVIRSVSISTQYAALIAALERCGYRETGADPTLVVFPYDWRKDNAVAAQRLADAIDTLAARLGADADITLVAHSMGGLVSRCYLESGTYAGRAGFGAVKRLITLATPHRGAPMALAAALGFERRLFLNADQVKTVANHAEFPSLYQLLPPAGEGFAWDRSDHARYAALDVYDAATAAKLGLSAPNLASAARFHAMLDLARRPAHVRYFFFAGTHETTTTSVQVRIDANKPRDRVRKIERDNGGDGTVPVWSALMTGVQSEQTAGSHGDIYKNKVLQSVLGVLLDRPGVLAAAGTEPELWVRHPVVEPDEKVDVTLELPAGAQAIQGELRLLRHANGAAAAQVAAWPVAYAGPPIDHLALVLTAPALPGTYEIVFAPADGAAPASTELFVQAP